MTAVLVEHGYTRPGARDMVELQQALEKFIYVASATDEPCDRA